MLKLSGLPSRVKQYFIPVEGKVVRGFEGIDIGHRIRVQLISVDVEQGYIDFKRVGQPGY